MTETQALPDLCPTEALIARLEAATGADYNLDALIWNAVGRPDTRTHDGTPCVLTYTASLDAALTLVPDGWEWGIHGNLWKYDLSAYVRKWVDDDLTVYSSRRPGVPTPNITPALALCIAGLRARATTR